MSIFLNILPQGIIFAHDTSFVLKSPTTKRKVAEGLLPIPEVANFSICFISFTSWKVTLFIAWNLNGVFQLSIISNMRKIFNFRMIFERFDILSFVCHWDSYVHWCDLSAVKAGAFPHQFWFVGSSTDYVLALWRNKRVLIFAPSKAYQLF